VQGTIWLSPLTVRLLERLRLVYGSRDSAVAEAVKRLSEEKMK
jgi:hypothetical protein